MRQIGNVEPTAYMQVISRQQTGTSSVFENLSAGVPETEGIKYAGSKLKLLPCILQLVHKVKPKTVLDGFAGTTRVAQALAQSGYCVLANDVAAWSKVFGTCYLLNPQPESHYQPMMDHLNALPGRDGWFTEHYGGARMALLPSAGTGSKNRGKYIIRGGLMPCVRKLNVCRFPKWKRRCC